MAPSEIEDLVASNRRRWGNSATEDGVFGSLDPDGVAGWYERLCDAELHSPVERGLFFVASAGCVAGVELADGRQVVIKAYQPRWNLDLLQVVSLAQQQLAVAGFACPTPEIPPLRFEGVGAGIDRLLPDPGMRLLESDEMSASAAPYAEAVAILADQDAGPWVGTHAMDRPGGSLYPVPHNPLFDFSLQAAEARWIDELATAALVAQDADDAPPRLVHGDWSARNIRVTDHRLVASYDWDSLGAYRESRGVGIAASAWRSTGEADDPVAPDSPEIDAYIDTYIEAAGGTRSRQWRVAAMGAALYTLAYTARCEHSLQARDASHQPRRARDTLEADRAGFLSALKGASR